MGTVPHRVPVGMSQMGMVKAMEAAAERALRARDKFRGRAGGTE